MRINTNINSMRTQEYMRQNQAKMSNAMDRLSSGKRINNASDDAAGLAIATRMRARESGLGVAADNTQNGMSLIRTADSAMNSVSNILLRMRDIANQSANGTNTDSNKAALQKEFGELQKQITYIADNTQFNDKNLLKENQTINIQTLDSDSSSKQIGIDLKAVTLDKLGIKDLAIGNSSNAAGDLKAAREALDALNQPGFITASDRDNKVATAKEAFDKVKDLFGSDEQDDINDAFTAYATTKSDDKAKEIYTALKAETLKTKNEKNFEAATTAFGNLSGATDTVFETDGVTVKTAGNHTNLVATAKEKFELIKDTLSKEDTQKLADAFTDYDKAPSANTAKAIGQAFTGMKAAENTNVDALDAVAKIDAALKTVADNRATLGATLNRLDFNVNNLKSQQSAMASSASQVEDADMAKEMSEMTKFKILNEAGISMLSQANQTPQMVSKLLQ
ncbi:flagellin [Bacillus thuringiensis LM1212]|uniref:flagellin N-terminal helical domain-containing protein n=1 Tax=Bacillus cereus group TaxID=86661 RepID=UPI0003FA4370|nr:MULTISPECIES: flagellin [Bacillus cereus group]AXY08793.1 flagellin [Bacillus thuringiensis LM1212]PFD85498.1 flagellin [Bacillus anthracis]QDF21702.1 flagellin [Bacillus tropicus]QUG95030.1 flagellin [Bacillus tropicus]